LKLPTTEQCSHVQQSCPRSDTVLEIPYTQLYFCASPAARPAAFVGLTVWLIFVFSTLGIAASDFFCPNLGTLSHVLGLDDNVAGVTFLAFGNGSPDVFSTFAAMKSHTASLALGELLGAATFISSVVVGSICLVKPFKVDPYMFLRDVGFFATAVALLQATLWDGKLYLWETLLLIGLYIIYVIIVIAGTWWSKRAEHRRKLAATVRSEYSQEEDPIEEPYQDEPSEY
jgi:sodium/potassium/calcium exchanger 6